ncbi:adenosine receptor A1-like [Penaeus monodon]|uniref:adenosine receptor A1-like n=1 Tax=Penaeus monodon TaxID=6687 RepID=UPI0018A77D38|nr:adenosine receptor A1-like [Penaeus monodon]
MQQDFPHLCDNRSLWQDQKCHTLADLCGSGASMNDSLTDVCADDELMGVVGNSTLLQICNSDINNLRAWLYPTIIPVFTVVTLVSGVVSSLVVVATPWVRRPMSPTIRLSLSLAAANTVVSFAIILDLLFNTYVPAVYPLLPCSSVYGHYVCVQLTIFTVKMAMILVQVLHLLVVAMNHYIGIRRPLHYATIVTPRFLKKVLAGLWVSPIAVMFAALSVVPGQGYQSPSCANNDFIENGITFRIVWICIFFGPTLLIILAYCHIFFLLKNRSLYLVSAEQRSQLRKNINTVATTALIVGTFVMGWVPAMVKYVLVCHNCPVSNLSFLTQLVLGIIVNSLYTLKVFIDTFIYALRLPDIRKALVTMWEAARKCTRGRPVPGNDHSRLSSSRTTSIQLSLSSSSLHRLRSTLSHGSPGSRSGSRSRSASPALHNNQSKRMASQSPLTARKGPLNLEVVAFTNSANDELRHQTLVEQPLDPILEDDIDYV